MNYQKIEDVLDFLSEFIDECEFNLSIEESVIKKIEEEQDVNVPFQYCQFLLKYNGGIIFNSIELFPLESKNIVSIKNKPYIYIGKFNFGDLLLIEAFGDNNVIQIGHDNKLIYNRWFSFLDFLLDSFDYLDDEEDDFYE